jgi:hypothetical protein
MKNLQPDEIRKLVQQAYGQIAMAGETGQTGCGCGCGGPDPDDYARSLGYSDEELKAIPASANLALSCGNPAALAGLRAGEIESLPVEDESVDVIISNCVINLSPDKKAVFSEIGVETAASSCGTGAETGDPIGRIIADSLGEGEALESCIASAYITARK